ncbi:MAG: gluconokinase [Armatimonadota bacterium]|nr:gluconokinase [Armatimonadota bacterium]
MKKALILTLDMGTSSVRAMLFDTRGRALPDAEAQIAYAQTTTADGGVETDAEALLGLTVKCVQQLLKKRSKEEAERIAGVGISCFWHSLVGVGNDNKAVTPLLSWADTRSQAQAEKLQSEVDEAAYHSRTGCVLHTSYWPAKLRWLHETQPQTFGKVCRWMSFGEYAALRLFGETKCSLSMASGTGLFDPNKKAWDEATLKDLPIDLDQLNPLANQGESQSGLTDEWARTLKAVKDLPWFPAWGDGACSNTGCAATEANRIAINLGTSGAMRVAVKADHVDIPDGLFCYRVDGERFLVGGAFANGGNVYAWTKQTLQLGDPKAAARAVAALPPDGHGLTVLPFWAGERSPGWHVGARATITGMNLHTTPQDILRASQEAVAYRFAAVRDLLTTQYPEAAQIIASGGALTHDPSWTQIMADVFGVPVTTSRVFEASSRGAALLALSSLGIVNDLGDVPAYLGHTYQPDDARHDIYAKARARQAALYAQLIAKANS